MPMIVSNDLSSGLTVQSLWYDAYRPTFRTNAPVRTMFCSKSQHFTSQSSDALNRYGCLHGDWPVDCKCWYQPTLSRLGTYHVVLVEVYMIDWLAHCSFGVFNKIFMFISCYCSDHKPSRFEWFGVSCAWNHLVINVIKGSLVANFRYTNFWVAWQE